MFNVGWKKIQVSDTKGIPDIPLLIFYPTFSEERAERFGPYELAVASGASLAPGKYPLVAISHGNGGSPFVHRDLARRLAQQGYVVVLPEHVGNSVSDNSLEGKKENLENRPRQLSLCIAHIKQSNEFGKAITVVYAIGHSIGGYTVLAAGGAKPYAGPHETTSGKVEAVAAQTAPEISALVLLAPATPWFQGTDSFDLFDVPTLIITGSSDTVTTDFHADIIMNGNQLSTKIEHKIIEGAGHFSFQSPFPQQMVSPQFPPSQDPVGFDRNSFQDELCLEILEFFEVA